MVFRRTYTVREKLRFVNVTDGLTLQEAFDQRGIPTSTLNRWRLQKESLEELFHRNKENVSFRLSGAGRRNGIKDDIIEQLLAYFDERRNNLDKVDVRLLLTKLRQIDPSVNDAVNSSNGCLAVRANLYKQINRILGKQNIGLRRVTHQAQNTRMSEEMMLGFRNYIMEKMQMLMIDHECIANFDETNVYFSPASHTTLDRRGSRTVSVRGSGMSSHRSTVMIGVSGDGHAFPPYLIFAGGNGETGQIYRKCRAIEAEQTRYRENPNLTPPETYQEFPFRCFYSVQAKAWMDSIHMLDWIERVWKPWTIEMNKPTMLILDEFSGHMTAEVRSAIVQCGTHLEFIPAGYTSKLQVMDVGFNKPFKDGFRHQFDTWVTQVVEKPHRHNVATWVQNSWEGMSINRIARNTWRRVGIPQPEQCIVGEINMQVPIVANEPVPVPIQGVEDEDVFNIVANTGQELEEELDLLYYDDTDM